jgi:1,4-dihydroxy-2-naphthoate octaprenyltransferase
MLYLRNKYKIRDFFLHLRLNYQIFILSGPYLLGVLLSNNFSYLQIIQFFSVHILLFGGVTAYNSYFDKDEGPIGGLKNPPKMKLWMLYASWILQIVGLVFAVNSGLYFVLIYLLSVLVFWMYSSPHIRLKGRPISSLLAIGLGTVICATLLGYHADGTMRLPSIIILLAALGSMCLVISMYPLSQAYQVKEDVKRGDITFSVKYGKRGVKNIFLCLFPIGIILIAYTLRSIDLLYSIIFIVGGFVAGFIVYEVIKKLTMTVSDYKMVMRVKYFGGLLFSLSIILFTFFRK